MTELSLCIPLFRSKYIAWLLFESLIRQQKINFEWELIVAEENFDEEFGYTNIENYIPRLKEIGCVNIIHKSLDRFIPLGTKTQYLISLCNEKSKVVTFAAADFYIPNLSIYSQFNALKDGNYDCYRSTKTIFYNIADEAISLYDTSKSRYKGDTSERGIITSIAKKIVKLKGIRRGLDIAVYRELLRLTNNNLRVYLDVSDNWKYGVCTHGLNNISGEKREIRIRDCKGGFIKIDHNLEDYIPQEIIEKLKKSKEYISLHKGI